MPLDGDCQGQSSIASEIEGQLDFAEGRVGVIRTNLLIFTGKVVGATPEGPTPGISEKVCIEKVCIMVRLQRLNEVLTEITGITNTL